MAEFSLTLPSFTKALKKFLKRKTNDNSPNTLNLAG